MKSVVESCYFENNIAEFKQSEGRRSVHRTSKPFSFSISQFDSPLTGDKSSGDDNGVLEDSSPLPENRHYLGEGADNEFGEGDGIGEEKSPKAAAPSELTRVLLPVPVKEAFRALDEWVEAGNEVTPAEVSSTAMYLQKYRLFMIALQVRVFPNPCSLYCMLSLFSLHLHLSLTKENDQ